MKYLITILILIFFLTANVMAKDQKTLSKNKVWEKAGGNGSAPQVKGMSRRELWAAASGGKKQNAPSYTKVVKEKKSKSKYRGMDDGSRNESAYLDKVQAERVKGGYNPWLNL